MNEAVILFVVFSFLGWVWESIYCSICQRKWANRGFLYGPVCPIYGFGCVLGFFTYNAIQKGVLPDLSVWQVFILGFIISMVLEYPTSWALEKLFNARWWDYSKVPLNINGRTSVPTSMAFGLAAILVMKAVIPAAVSLLGGIPAWVINLAALIFVSIITADFTLTVSALTDFQRLVNELDAAFQSEMTNRVYKIMNSQNHIFRKAIKRASAFKLPTRKIGDVQKLRREKFNELIAKYIDSPDVQKMDKYIQHGKTTTLEHCKNVAWISFLINERLHLNADEKELVEAALLHDFYLYDWHDGNPERKNHGTNHPYIAGKNASEKFDVSDKTKASIKSHMWPLNITEIPKSKEALILCIVDKYCALIEMLRVSKKNKNNEGK